MIKPPAVGAGAKIQLPESRRTRICYFLFHAAPRTHAPLFWINRPRLIEFRASTFCALRGNESIEVHRWRWIQLSHLALSAVSGAVGSKRHWQTLGTKKHARRYCQTICLAHALPLWFLCFSEQLSTEVLKFSFSGRDEEHSLKKLSYYWRNTFF
jgi:hypothetical protein